LLFKPNRGLANLTSKIYYRDSLTAPGYDFTFSGKKKKEKERLYNLNKKVINK